LWMRLFLMPAEVRRNLMMALGVIIPRLAGNAQARGAGDLAPCG
jgi:hypothetical protein